MIKYHVDTLVDGIHDRKEVWAKTEFHAHCIAKKILARKISGLNPKEYGFAVGVKIPLERKDDNA